MQTNLQCRRVDEQLPGRGEGITKGHKETFGCDEHVHYVDVFMRYM